MSNLIVIAYDDVATAIAARDKLSDLQRQHLVTLEDAAVVEHRENGRVKLHQVNSSVGRSAVGGVVWGGLIGLLLFVPFVGMAVGGMAGAAIGLSVDPGVDDDLMKQLGDKLVPGGAALFLLVLDSTPDKVVPEIAQYGGHIIRTSLSAEQEATLRDMARQVRQPVN